jgi:hypothetical protein
MLLSEIIWKERFATKIEWKHGVVADEVEEVLLSRPLARRAQRVACLVRTSTSPMARPSRAAAWSFFSFSNAPVWHYPSQPGT